MYMYPGIHSSIYIYIWMNAPTLHHVSAVSSILRLMQVKPTLVFFFLPIGLVVSIGDWP